MALNLSRNLLRSASRIAIVAASAVLLGGCGGAGVFSSGPDSDRGTGANSSYEPEPTDFVGGAAYWGARYQANRGDTKAALSFAKNLRLMGGSSQAVTVMKQVVMANPDDAMVLAEYGKALTSAGRSKDAVPFLTRSVQINGDDWSTISALGVALDQSGDHKTAQQNYAAALKLSPANPAVETNMAMSYVLEGRVDEAEITLRRLVARPDATPEMRQNLAMIATLKGDATEAEQLVREDLPPVDATNNLSILRQLNARNAPVNTQTLAPPPESALPPPATAKEAAVVEPAPVPVQETAGQGASTTVLATAPAATDALKAAKPAPVMMAPINDDDETPATKPKPATAAPRALTPTGAMSKIEAPASGQPAAIAPLTVPADKAADETKTTPVLRQSFDVYRRPATVSVANAN